PLARPIVIAPECFRLPRRNRRLSKAPAIWVYGGVDPIRLRYASLYNRNMEQDGTNENDTPALVERAAQGDNQAWESLLSDNRMRLRRMVSLRMDRRLQGRIDPSDVIQESCVEAAQRLREYAKNPSVPFFVWLRWIVGQRLMEQHRRHLGAQGRDASRDVSLYQGNFPEATTADLAANLLANITTPSQAAIRIEEQRRLQDALDSLDPINREILVLRHFEQLSNGEAAEVLELDKSTASKRYTRALIRLKEVIVAMPGGEDLL
ncbi:MAG TPA: sigma-70 family RNA polymerase sigma factor, partial [Lacipirellulaceae bacterium]|nr:sigma-70 family RNA polymerase sigma factor [Lacipirellulaceae bacterium]